MMRLEDIRMKDAEEVMRCSEYEGVVKGIPTGMYVDRVSYGNAPRMAFVLDGKLSCKMKARPYSHRNPVQGGEEAQNKSWLQSLTDNVLNATVDDENEMLGIAAAFMDQSIINIKGNSQNESKLGLASESSQSSLSLSDTKNKIQSSLTKSAAKQNFN